MRRCRALVGVIVAVALGSSVLVGCAGDSSSTGQPAGSPTTATPGTTSTGATAADVLVGCIEGRDPGAGAVLGAIQAGDTTGIADDAAMTFVSATAACYAVAAALPEADAQCFVAASAEVVVGRGATALLADMAAVTTGRAEASVLSAPVDAQMQRACPDRAGAIRQMVDAVG